MSSDKGGPKRTETQRERDLAIISELYLRGVSDYDIAKIISEQYGEFDLSDRTIRNDKQELRKRWIESQIINFDEAKARELELIERLIEACWKGWENSQEDEGFITETISEGDKLAGGESEVPIRLTSYKKIQRRAARDGNSVWIDEMRKLSDQRAKIYGLYEAEKFQIDWRERLQKAGIPKTEIDKTLDAAMDTVEKAFSSWEDTN